MTVFKIIDLIVKYWKWKMSLKSSKYRNYTGFLAYVREGNDISNIHSKFQDHTVNTFGKMATFNFLRWWQPSPTRHIWQLTYPRFLFHQNDRKKCTLDLPRWLRSRSFLFFFFSVCLFVFVFVSFSCEWESPVGVVTIPLVIRGLTWLRLLQITIMTFNIYPALESHLSIHSGIL